MELRHLRYFCAVASELHFTRAAERLGIAQPPLTQQIKALEAELNVTLFDRSSRHVALTSAGRLFYRDATKILEAVHNAVIVARQGVETEPVAIRIGFTESASFHSVVTSAIHRFRQKHKAVKVDLQEDVSSNLLKLLETGKLDVAFVRPPFRHPALQFHKCDEEQMLVAVPHDHHLAGRRFITLEDVRKEPFVLYPRDVGPGLADAVIDACEAAGFTPIVVQHTPQMSSTINMVAAGMGISIVPASLNDTRKNQVVYLPIRGPQPRAILGMALSKNNFSAVVASFKSLTLGS